MIRLLSFCDQGMRSESCPINLGITYGMSQAMIEIFVSLSLLLLNSLQSKQAIFDLPKEISQSVAYMKDVMHQKEVAKTCRGRLNGKSVEQEDDTDTSCSTHMPRGNVQNDVANCGACGEENCTGCKEILHHSDGREESAEIPQWPREQKRQQWAHCGKSATRCNNMQ